MSVDRALERLQDCLPGHIKKIIAVSTVDPNDLIAQINTLPPAADCVIIHFPQPWLPIQYQTAIDHMSRRDTRYFIAAPGYHNRRITDNIFELSFPTALFLRRQTAWREIQADFGFSCLNRSAYFHRILLGSMLHHRKLLQNMIYSQDIQGLKYLDDRLWTIWERYDPDGEFRDLLPLRWNEPLEQPVPQDQDIGHEAYHRSWCNIVTESTMQSWKRESAGAVPGVTAKSFKPFLSCQIPIFLAAQGHLDYMERMGFQVMRDLLPKIYDSMPLQHKISAICDVVARGSEFIQDFYQSNLRQIAYNHWWIHRDTVDWFVFRDIDEFLRDNI